MPTLRNRLDMGQGIETALAMICAKELDADWALVRTGFGNQQRAYVDPLMGMHLTGGSNSVKNSYMQYRELGARTKAMLLAAASRQLGVPVAQLTAAKGRVSAGTKSLGYGALFEAAMREPIPEKVILKDPKTFGLIGKPKGLTVAKAKSPGAQIYGIDFKLPGMVVALIAHPPVFGAKLTSFDASAAQAVKGVRAVLPVKLDRGAQGVVVVASGYWPAKMGRDALKLEWDTTKVEQADSTELETRFRTLAATPGTRSPSVHLQADTSAIAQAERTLQAEFVFPYLNHAQLEPLACTIDLKADRCDIYTASQMPGVDAGAVAKAAGLAPEKVHMHVQMGGAGFGRRAVPTSEYVLEALAVAQALAANGKAAPVKVVRSREDDMRAGYYRPFTVHRAEIGCNADGQIRGWRSTIVSQSIAKGTPFRGFMLKGGVDATTTEGMRDGYAIPMDVRVHHPDVNVPVLWWRAVGSTHTAYVMETLVDEIAEAIGQDPVAYRMKLLRDDAPRHKAALQLAVDKSGYGKRKLPAGHHWGVAVHESFESVVAYVVEASLKEGKPVVHAATAGVHCNLAINPKTIEAQVQGSAVMALSTCLAQHAITLKNGEVEQGNFHQFSLARITDTLNVAVHIVPSTDAPKGMGEPALPPFAPALANALRCAGGKPLRKMPFELA